MRGLFSPAVAHRIIATALSFSVAALALSACSTGSKYGGPTEDGYEPLDDGGGPPPRTPADVSAAGATAAASPTAGAAGAGGAPTE